MTTQLNEKNERTKREFLTFRKHAKQVSEKTLDREVAHLERFDVWNRRKDFAKFHIDWAVGFREHLDHAKSANGKPLAKSTTRAIMATMREFTLWLSQQDGFRRRIKAADASYFQLSRRDEAEARAAPERPAPSIRQAKRALAMMPSETPRQMRDKAIFALLCLTGIRVEALTSLKIKHLDLEEKSVTQNPREVATKFGKRIDTFFAKDFAEAEAPLRDWTTYLDEVALYSPDDPLFPATALTTQSNKGFTACGFTRAHWKTTEPARKIVNTAFEAAGLPAFGPHAFRHMLARHAAKNSKTVAEFIANAQNLGHSDPLTTLRSYGQISRDDQRRLITGESE
ncbi:tyrosine-type recombinase/integrase [Phaeobacter inhibens]|uniref:tyrosine-type recombinase/integrase n=1 Tax=Phaeobacter inhibens TaxID=221822 RepID=UPI000C9C2315|nr:site-specific integrase [Phaeobacter inhibens]AUQ57422.1 site-specific tyrosine recombinase XerC [Phaeobacter inhibens]AUQ81431.1 site-specific tyrosine recombinase XerC [Phaeobacter inhibens]AUR06708.1 site-specific tyrosine recombinase XerC [Phaeobacter inhibens]